MLLWNVIAIQVLTCLIFFQHTEPGPTAELIAAFLSACLNTPSKLSCRYLFTWAKARSHWTRAISADAQLALLQSLHDQSATRAELRASGKCNADGGKCGATSGSAPAVAPIWKRSALALTSARLLDDSGDDTRHVTLRPEQVRNVPVAYLHFHFNQRFRLPSTSVTVHTGHRKAESCRGASTQSRAYPATLRRSSRAKSHSLVSPGVPRSITRPLPSTGAGTGQRRPQLLHTHANAESAFTTGAILLSLVMSSLHAVSSCMAAMQVNAQTLLSESLRNAHEILVKS
jgi:hypothetical protein